MELVIFLSIIITKYVRNHFFNIILLHLVYLILKTCLQKYIMALESDWVEDRNYFRPNLVQDPDNWRLIAVDFQILLIIPQMWDDDRDFHSNIFS